MNIHKMLAVAAIVAGVGAYAATPVAVWDGDFTTLTKGTFTLSENGNTRTDTYLQVSGENGILVTSTDALNVFTVLVRCEGLNLAAENAQVLFTSYGAQNSPHDNKTGVNLPANNALCRGIWEGVDWNSGATQGSVPSNYTTLIYNHQQTNGTYAYALGPTSDSDDTVVLTTLYSVVGLRSSGTTYKGFAIGGMRGTTSATLLPATGLKITGIAVFSGTLTEAEMTGYIWPHETIVTPGYEDFGATAGIVLWRGTQDKFYNSTVIDIDRNGSEGTSYSMMADNSSTSWQRFARGQAAYVSPGKVLVYDSPGTGDGYKYNSNADFTPISFGGMWVKTLAINGLPFSIIGDSANRRLTEFGASGRSTLFRFDKSFTINRTSTTTFYGNATVEIAEGATFTAQADSNYNVAVDSAAALILKGAGTLAVTTMNVAGTLDISAATVPNVTGNVTLAGGATLVVPAGTKLNENISVQICTGTLAVGGTVNVKVGDIEPVEALLTIADGKITKIETDLEYELTLNGTATNWSSGNWKRNGQSASAPTVGNIIITASASTELTVDANVNLSSLKVKGGRNIVVKVKTGENGSLYSKKVTIESGVFQQGSAAVLGATPEIVVGNGATFDLNGLAINGSNAISVEGAGAGSWPWAITSSGGEFPTGTFQGLTLNGNATIGGANKIGLGVSGAAKRLNIGTYTLTKTGAGELSFTNMRSADGSAGTLDIRGGSVTLNEYTNLDGSNKDNGDRPWASTTVIVRSGAGFTSNLGDRSVRIDTLVLDGGTATTKSNPFAIATAFTGAGTLDRITLDDGATVTLSGDLSITSSFSGNSFSVATTAETSEATLSLSAETTSVGSIALGAGAKLNLKNGTGTLNVATSLDISTASLPFVTGNVTIDGGATLVVSEDIVLNEDIEIVVCSGTLTANGIINVKVGDGEPSEAVLTISSGTITKIETEFETEKTFTANYPAEVPVGFTYTYQATEETTIPTVTVKGTLITKGPITITELEIAEGANFEVASGNTTVGCSADCKLMGNITVDAGATLTNTRTDSLSYNHAMTVDIYGTLAMGATRWSIPSGCTFNLHAGAAVTGQGDQHCSLDFVSGADKGLDVYGVDGEDTVTIEGKIRVRANESRIWIAENTRLVLESGITNSNGSERFNAGFKQVGTGTLEIHANNAGLSGNTSVMTAGTVRLVDTSLAFPIDLQGNSALEIVATDNITTVPVDVTIANDNVTFSGDGKADGKITKTSAPDGDLATFLQSEKWEGSFVANWEGAKGTRFNVNSYGNANSVVEVTKLAGGYASDGSAENFVVVPTVNVSGTMILDNGFSGKSTTLTRLTGSGTFTSQTYTINVTTLDNFTGTLVPNVNMTIDTINLAYTPKIGDKVVTLGSNARIANISATKVSVDGVVVDSLGLEVKSGGIYVTDATEEHVARVGDVDYYDSLVDALWDAEEGDIITILADVELDDDPIVIDYGITITGDKAIRDGVLQIDSGTTLTLDGTLAVTSAIEFVGDGATLVVGPDVTGVTAESMRCAEEFYGAITPAQDDPETGWTTYTAATIMTDVEVTPGNATVTGVETGLYPCGTTIEFSVEPNENFKVVSVKANDAILIPDATTGKYSVTVGEAAIEIVVTTADAPKMIQVTVTAENATVTNQDTSEALVSGSYEQGSELKFTVAANENYTLVSVKANVTDVVPAEGIYSVTVGEDAISIVVTVEEESQSSGTYEITDKTVLDENGSFEVPDDTTKIMLGEYDVTEGFEINRTSTPWTATLKKPELKETTAGDGDQFVVGDDNTVTLNVALVKGLYYGVGASTSLAIARPSPLKLYTGDTGVVQLTADKPGGASGFFKVFVDIKP